MLFKNRELKVQMVKTNKNNNPDSQEPGRDPVVVVEQINQIARDDVRDLAILIGIGYVAKKVLDTCTEITVLAAKANIK